MTVHYNDLYARCDDIAQTVAALERALEQLEAQVAQLEQLVGNHLYGGTNAPAPARTWPTSWPI